MKIGALGLPPYRTFSLEELEEATNNFHASTFLGEGSRGQVFASGLVRHCGIGINKSKKISPPLLRTLCLSSLCQDSIPNFRYQLAMHTSIDVIEIL